MSGVPVMTRGDMQYMRENCVGQLFTSLKLFLPCLGMQLSPDGDGVARGSNFLSAADDD